MAVEIGLALGGGAARGIAHIPLLEVFDELGIKPVKIAGTSIGALMGAAYASGISARDIRRHTIEVLNNRVDAARHIFQQSEGKLFDLINFSFRKPTQVDGTKLAELALPNAVAANIEDTEIEFVVNTTDFFGHKEVVIDSGPLVEAVAASMAIPGMIEAPFRDDLLLIDGAMTNPVPFEHVSAPGRIVVAIDVTGGPYPDGKRPGYTDLAFGATQIMQLRISELARQLSPPDIYIEPDLSRFRAHDFFKVRELLATGEAEKDKLKRELDKLLTN